MAALEVKVPGHRRLQGRRDHRGARQAGRPHRSRPVADHGRERQGVDGDPVERGRRRQGDEGQGRRQGERRVAGAGARWRRRRAGRGIAGAGSAAAGRRQRRRAPAARQPPAASPPGPRAQAAGRGGAVEVVVPDIGDFDEVAVIEVLVKPGDTVAARAEPRHRRERQGVDGDPVERGRRRQGRCRVKVGDKVSQGTVLAVVRATGAVAPPSSAVTQGAATSPAEDRVGSAPSRRRAGSERTAARAASADRGAAGARADGADRRACRTRRRRSGSSPASSAFRSTR